MKKIRCPKCQQFIVFDENECGEKNECSANGTTITLACPHCGKQFKLKIPTQNNNGNKTHKKTIQDPQQDKQIPIANLIVIENKFHYKQIIPLKMGDNIIGRFMKGSKANAPIHTDDPSIDLCHCIINLSRKKINQNDYDRISQQIKTDEPNIVAYLSDGPSNTGTFVGNELLAPKEKRRLHNGQLFTIGATSIILQIN